MTSTLRREVAEVNVVMRVLGFGEQSGGDDLPADSDSICCPSSTGT